DRERLRSGETEPAERRRRLAGEPFGRRERDVGLAPDRPADPELEGDLAADVVGEPQVDLLAEDRRQQRLPERWDSGPTKAAEEMDRRGEQRIRAARAVEPGEVGAGAERD